MAIIQGTSGNDSLLGTSDTDTIAGMAGDDTIQGGRWFDQIDGGPGTDTIEIGPLEGAPTLLNLADGGDLVRLLVPVGEFHVIWDTNEGAYWHRRLEILGTTVNPYGSLVPGGGLDRIQFANTGVFQVVRADRPRDTASDEVLPATFGNDILDGGGGSDVLVGSIGNDTLAGGGGDDFLFEGHGGDNDWLDGGDGVDLVSYAGVGAQWNQHEPGVTIDLRASTAISATSSDQVYNFEAAVGSAWRDTLIGRDGAGDTLNGYLGNDTLYGGSLDDVLLGGDADDVLHGQQDDDTLDGGLGIDSLYGGDGFNVLRGGEGPDALFSAGTADTLEGGRGNDTLVLEGGSARIVVGAGDGHDTIHGFTAGGTDDVLVLRGTTFRSLSDVLAASSDEGSDLLLRNGASTSVRLTGVNKAQLTAADIEIDSTPVVVRTGPQRIIGTSGSDTLEGSSYKDTIEGLAGDDWIDGRGGSDQISTGPGNDYVVVGLGYGHLNFSEINGSEDTLVLDTPLEDLAWVKDRFYSYAPYLPDWDYFRDWRLTDDTTIFENRRSGGDLIYLRARDHASVRFEFRNLDIHNILPGGDQAERLDGGNGDDILYGNGGADVLLGGAGNDYVAVGIDDTQADWLDGGNGVDTVSYSGATGTGVTIDIGRGYAVGAGVGSDQVFNFEAAIGSAGSDVIIGRDGAGDTLKGYWGNDWLYAGSADDLLYGQHGNDVLLGEADDDTLDGGEGDDWLYGGSGSNSIAGGGGVDVLISQGTNDTLAGGDGGDYLYAYGDGITQAAGGAGNDIFVMQQGSSYASGNEGQDYFYMGAGNDTMMGGADVDVLLGGGGNDVFDGGTGTDYLFLGAGNSIVLFRADSGADVIHGFKAAGSQHGVRFEGTRFASVDDILAATYDFNGDALIRLDSDTVVWLVGTSRSQLSAADFEFR